MKRLAFLLIFLLLPLTSFAQPQEAEEILGEEVTPVQLIEIATTASSDSVFYIPNGEWAIRETIKGSETIRWHAQCPNKPSLMGCSTHMDSLISDLRQPPEEWYYADNCLHANNGTHKIENATVHASELGSVEPGDTLAVFTPDGTCAGYGVYSSNGVTFAAHGSDELDFTPDGFSEGDSLRLQVGKEEKTATFQSCEDTNIPVCREHLYTNGGFHEIKELQ